MLRGVGLFQSNRCLVDAYSPSERFDTDVNLEVCQADDPAFLSLVGPAHDGYVVSVPKFHPWLFLTCGDSIGVRVIFRGAPSTFVFLFNPMFIFVNVYVVCMSESFESCRL